MTERNAVALGALLHDIGKFWQRTGREKHLYEEFAKGEAGRYGLHALWSGLFFHRFVVKRFPELEEAGLFAQFHHNPSILRSGDESRKEELTALVQEADHLAAQFDRDKRPDDSPKGNPAFDRLEAVTERIDLNDGAHASRRNRASHHYPLTPLSISDGVFPIKTSPEENRSERLNEDYSALWDGFIEEHEKLPHGNFTAYFDSLLHLLHKYAWCIPSATYIDYPSISLYDHSRVTSALAVCLYETRRSAQSGAPKNGEEFLFIEGDISGIQKFIYNPTFNGQELQAGMSRRLRGRSFYLNLLLKTIADYLIGEIDLFSVNAIWATGGHFLIIAPNTETARDRLSEACLTIRRWVWREFRGSLDVPIADVTASREDLKDFGRLQKKIAAKIGKLKLTQIAVPLGLSEEFLDEAWLSAWALGMKDEICRDTGRDLSNKEKAISDEWQLTEEGEEIQPRSAQSILFDRIGRALVSAKTIQLRRTADWNINDVKVARIPLNIDEAKKTKFWSDRVLIEFHEFKRAWLLSDLMLPRQDADLCLRIADRDNKQIVFLPDQHSIESGTTACGFEMLADAVKHTKDKDTGRDRIMEFDELAEESKGAKFLGVLRMDVDNLGRVFAEGLPPNERSLSKIANLSRMIDWFFIGYLNSLVAGNNLYTTYAGGDDLFIVGAWNEILVLAEAVQSDFKRFCGHNPDLHISGAVALCKGKYPIGRAAEDAGEMLDGIAKTKKSERVKDDTDKDALAFLNRKITWKRWEEVRELGDELIEAIEDSEKKLSRKFIYNLLSLYRQHIDPERDRTKENAGIDRIWFPRFLYSLARNVKDKELRVRLQTSVFEHMDYLLILAGYVSLKTRSANRE